MRACQEMIRSHREPQADCRLFGAKPCRQRTLFRESGPVTPQELQLRCQKFRALDFGIQTLDRLKSRCSSRLQYSLHRYMRRSPRFCDKKISILFGNLNLSPLLIVSGGIWAIIFHSAMAKEADAHSQIVQPPTPDDGIAGWTLSLPRKRLPSSMLLLSVGNSFRNLPEIPSYKCLKCRQVPVCQKRRHLSTRF